MSGTRFEYDFEDFQPRSQGQIIRDSSPFTNQENSINGNGIYSNNIGNSFGNFDNFTSNTVNHEANNLNTSNPTEFINNETPFYGNNFEFTSNDFAFPDIVDFTPYTDIVNPSFSATTLPNIYGFQPTDNEVYFNRFPIYNNTVNSIGTFDPNTGLDYHSEGLTIDNVPLNPTNPYLVNFNSIGLTSANFGNTNTNVVYPYTNMIPPPRSTRGALPARFDSNFGGYGFTRPEHHHPNRLQSRHEGSYFGQSLYPHRHHQPYLTSNVYGNTFANPYHPQGLRPVGNDEHPTNSELAMDAAFAEFTVNGDFSGSGVHQGHIVIGHEQRPLEDSTGDETLSTTTSQSSSGLSAYQDSPPGAERVMQNSMPDGGRSLREALFDAPNANQGLAPLSPHDFWNVESLAVDRFEQLCTRSADGVWVAPDPLGRSEERSELAYQLHIAVSHPEERGMVPEEWTEDQLWPGSQTQ